MHENIQRMVLGTAQLGMPYGIANRTGQPNLRVATAIVRSAWDHGIREYDTAQAYGQSEEILGRALREAVVGDEVKVITKLDPLLDLNDSAKIMTSVRKSLSLLGIRSLYCLMLHREEHLELWSQGLKQILQGFVRKGLTENLGVSVYSPKMAVLALNTDGIDMIQIPSNILDRRFEKAGVFQLAGNNGKRIYVRSVFLQGLLFMDSERVPANMQFAVEVLKKLGDFSQETGLSKQELALGYVRQAYPQAKVVLGVETPAQISGNLKSWETTLPVGFVERVQEEFGYVEERILNPALWPN